MHTFLQHIEERFGLHEGRMVPLEQPLIEEPELNSPKRGGKKKYIVYVKNPKTNNVNIVRFGDPNMEIRRDNPKRLKSFRARHKCSTRDDPTTASYWSCKMWEKKKSVTQYLK